LFAQKYFEKLLTKRLTCIPVGYIMRVSKQSEVRDMKTFHLYGHFNPVNETSKAYAFNAMYGIKNEYFWVPKSACIVTEPNEEGNQRIWIPDWIFRKNGIDPQRVSMNYWGKEQK